MFTGAYTRIDEGPLVFVKVRTGLLGLRSEWRRVDLSDVSLNAYYPDHISTTYGKHLISDLPIGHKDLAKLLGISRLDPKRANEIWQSSRTVKGGCLAIDTAEEELAHRSREFPHRHPTLVFPFSSIAAIVRSDDTYLSRKHDKMNYNWLTVGDFPLSLKELATLLGVPIVGGDNGAPV